MPVQLIVLLGAGASYDCASDNVEKDLRRRPPLTSELFRRDFSEILNRYPLAEAAAADIEPGLAAKPVALETYLRETLRDSTHLHRRLQFRAVPLYLQDLFFEISAWDPPMRGYTIHPDNYNRLISAALELDQVVFVTLNYDTLLDRRLFAYAPLETMDSYIHGHRNWSLIKLHGSVNWGRLVTSAWRLPPTDPHLANAFRALGDDFTVASDVVLRTAHDIRGVRHEGAGQSGSGALYYPALSAPLGPGDEITCPPSHVEHLRSRLVAQDGLNLLVIGYSGLDSEVLKLLSLSRNSLKTLTVVSELQDAARTTAAIISSSMGNPDFAHSFRTRAIGTGFDSFARTDALRRTLDALD
jgi:hypothetical protein